MLSNKPDKELLLMQEVIIKASEKYDTNLPEDSSKMIKIVEDFIKKKKRIVYGGIAVNNILPKKDRFYKPMEFPDWDFFSPDALQDAKELADIFYKSGFGNVEAKSGIHFGTYKVYVNFFGVADITQLDYFYDKISPYTINKDNIPYAPANWLRMSLYLELSRPKGDITRWEKLLPRLRLLNKYYPIKEKKCNFKNLRMKEEDYFVSNKIKDILMSDKVIFFGAYADKLYSYYTNKNYRVAKYNDYDVLSIDAKGTGEKVKNKLKKYNINIEHYHNRGELIPEHYSIIYNGNNIGNIYQTEACYSYNRIKVDNKSVNIATIFTILSLYLCFLYTDKEFYNTDRLICTSNMMQDIYLKHKTKNKGILKIYTVDCIGEQATFEDILAEKKKAFKDIKKNSPDYEKWFLRYTPKEKKKVTKKTKKKVTKKVKKKVSKTKKNKK
tara:strand:+ start:1878 stop:3197 length:1320 start_codon:yes stop_codon:yes gene_type:complete